MKEGRGSSGYALDLLAVMKGLSLYVISQQY